jgi:hypothetical protein
MEPREKQIKVPASGDSMSKINEGNIKKKKIENTV